MYFGLNDPISSKAGSSFVCSGGINRAHSQLCALSETSIERSTSRLQTIFVQIIAKANM